MSEVFKFMLCCLALNFLSNNLVANESCQLQSIESVNGKNDVRHSKYHRISKYLETLSNKDIASLLSQGTPLHSGYGTSVKLEINGTPIFVKKVPLNIVEGSAANLNSTANLFELPLYYQYGVGSAGFNVWREVSAHLMSTNWVLSNKTQNFPLVYHWRILDNSEGKEPFDEEKWKKYIDYWDGSLAIGERVKANHDAPAYIALFIEYYPMTLNKWLTIQLAKGASAIDKAVEMVERNLIETTAFMNRNGMLHFDAHFHNILTDGERIYFSDFGLATSLQFSLSNEELQFFYNHQNYDRCYVVTALTNWVVSRCFGRERSEEVLKEYATGKIPLLAPEVLTPYLSSVVKRYAPLALRMSTFFKTIREESKQAPYPEKELEKLWVESISFPLECSPQEN